MTRFRDGELDVLVGTTVVEVGVDVPAATMMVIEGADRFGLAQLHQLRGRVGRGTVESFCVLVSDSTDEIAQARLQGGRRDRTTGSRSPRRTSSCARRATSSGSPRAGSRACGSPRSRSPRTATWRSGRAPHAEALLDAAGRLDPPRPALAAELEIGLAPAGRGRANRRAARDRAAWLTPAGSSPGRPAGSGSRRPAPATRPLGDRVKQTLFAILEPDLPGARVLDLFAGSGAAGIEALSRGAAHATFVERDTGAAAVIAANLGADPPRPARGPRIVRAEALAWLRGPDAAAAGPFDIVIVDPPYAETGAPGARRLERARARCLAPGARVVAKHFWRDPPPADGRAASIRARAPLRRDDADLLPTPGGSMNTIAVYPGSFDPITNGHLDIVGARRGRLRPVDRRRPRQPAEDAAARRSRRGSRSSARPLAEAGVAARPDRGRGVRRPDRRLLPGARRQRHRPRPARDQRLRDRDAARPQQPGPRAGRRHGLLHDLGRERLRQLEPGQGDRVVRRRRLGDDPGGGPCEPWRRRSRGR